MPSDTPQCPLQPLPEEELFRTAFNEGPLGMAIVDLDYRFIKVNANLCRMLGYSSQELTLLTFPEITHPDDIDSDLDLARRLFAGEIPHYQIEKRYLKKDGGIVWIKLSGSVIRDADGKACYGFAMIEDISSQKQAAENLARSEERFRTFAEALDAVAWIVNLAPEQVLFVNSAFTRIWGRSTEELYRSPRVWVEAIHPDDRPAVLECFDNWLNGVAEDYRTEFRIVRPDGTIRWIADHGVKMFDAAGNFFRVCGIAEDITERKSREKEAEQTRAELQALFANAPLAMLLTEGPTERVVDINRRFQETIGYAVEEMPDVAHWWRLAYPDPDYRQRISELWHQRMQQAIRDRASLAPVEAEIRCKNGERRIVEVHATSLGHRHLVIFVDLTEVRRLEQQLREAESRFRTAFQSAPIGMALVSDEGQWLQVNEVLCEFLGYSEAELLARTVQDLTYPDDLETDRILIEELMAGKNNTYTTEKRYFDKQGRIVWALVARSALHDAKGRVIHFIVQVQDITRRKQQEHEREQLIRRLQEALANVRTLRGLLPICASCKKIRDDKGYWNQIESYISAHSQAVFSHSVCPACAKKLYPDQYTTLFGDEPAKERGEKE